ncbi:hypothetical protein EDB89DRAFT_1917231 [Lactarius sanguifluus]|nr:hypothetical protein EDB89DRAFT_1917231 [Lactarius sanguifluus]
MELWMKMMDRRPAWDRKKKFREGSRVQQVCRNMGAARLAEWRLHYVQNMGRERHFLRKGNFARLSWGQHVLQSGAALVSRAVWSVGRFSMYSGGNSCNLLWIRLSWNQHVLRSGGCSWFLEGGTALSAGRVEASLACPWCSRGSSASLAVRIHIFSGMRKSFAGFLQVLIRSFWIVVNLTKPILLGNPQLAFNLPFNSARWKGAKYSQYFGLSLKLGNQWCFLLIREFVGKCSWNSRGSSSLVCLDLVIAGARSAGEIGLVGVKRFFLLGGHYVLLVVLGSRPSLGVVKVKRVILLNVLGSRPSLGVVEV